MWIMRCRRHSLRETAQLAQVKAPYSGTVRRVKWLGQSADGSLGAEITLMVTK